MKTFLNLSNGMEMVNSVEWDGFVRIQSTMLEQCKWELVLQNLDVNFLMWAATGPVTIVDGGSSRGPKSRAMWQGVPWITYALERAWFSRITKATILNSEYNVSRDFSRYYEELSKSALRKLKYFRTYLSVESVDIRTQNFCAEFDGQKDKYKELWNNYNTQS